MTASVTQSFTLQEFLNLPYIEESPAWEYIYGVAMQKPMPKIRHSILQKRLIAEIDRHSNDYTALPELRCTFGERSIVPDIAVVAWNKIPVNESGELEDNFTEAPDWTIEILSPEQKAIRVIDNILYCLKHGCKLGWLIDPDDYSILTFIPQQEVEIYRGDRQLPILEGVDLRLTAAQVFEWLKVGKKN
jgi:Uma2 family endonuclease